MHYYRKTKKDKENIYTFEQAIERAKEIIKMNADISREENTSCKVHPIFSFINLIVRPIQSKLIFNSIYDSEVNSLIEFGNCLFDLEWEVTKDRKTLRELILVERYETKLKLGRDIVLPWPWHTDRIASSICRYGENRHEGNWKQDENHRVYLWLPFRVGFVVGGNHSISAGVLNAEGEIIPTKINNCSQYYNYIYTDGAHYKLKSDNSIIQQVESVEFAIMYEVGRLIIENDIEYKL